MAEAKFSRQRAAIKKELESRKDHPTADELYIQLRLSNPTISLGTVYRNLNQMAEKDQILRIAQEGNPVRFDGNSMPHYHFACKSCGRVTDIDMPVQHQLEEKAAALTDAEIKGHNTLFFGVCRGCLDKN